MTIVDPPSDIPIVDNNALMEQIFRLWVQEVTALSPLRGSGSPEGVIEANQWREYIDETGTTGSIKYIKQYSDIGGDKSQGWTLL